MTKRFWVTLFLSPTYLKVCLAPLFLESLAWTEPLTLIPSSLPPDPESLSYIKTQLPSFFSCSFSPSSWLKASWTTDIFPLIINLCSVPPLEEEKKELTETLIFLAFPFCQLKKVLCEECNCLDIYFLTILNYVTSFKKQKLLQSRVK